MNTSVTLPHVRATNITNLVLICRVHFTSGKASQKEVFVGQFQGQFVGQFFKVNLLPKDNAFAEKQPHHGHHRFCSTFQISKYFLYRYLEKCQTRTP